MYYSRKKPVEEAPDELTSIWSCSSEDCKGWMRDNFTFQDAPVCVLCHAPMVKGERMLAAVANTSPIVMKNG